MYRKKGTNIVLEDILAKVRNPAHTVVYVSTVYAGSDIVKAKTVLDRLLAMTERTEISSIKEAVTEVSET